MVQAKKCLVQSIKMKVFNKKARFEYELAGEGVEAGISLLGIEAKSIRDGRVDISQSAVRILGDEAFLIELVKEFQQRSILKTKNESFNQIIFNNFAEGKQKADKAQFFTPIPVVNAIGVKNCALSAFC